MVACDFVFNRVRIGRNFPLTITKKPQAYEKNTLHLANTVRELPGKPPGDSLKIQNDRMILP